MILYIEWVIACLQFFSGTPSIPSYVFKEALAYRLMRPLGVGLQGSAVVVVAAVVVGGAVVTVVVVGAAVEVVVMVGAAVVANVVAGAAVVVLVGAVISTSTPVYGSSGISSCPHKS